MTKTFEHLGRRVFSRCFVLLLEKRVKKALGRVFSKNERVLVVGELAGYFFDKIMGGFPLEVVRRKRMPKSFRDFDKIVVELTMDDVDAGFLADFFGANFKIDKNKKIVRILGSITDEEAIRFAKIKGIKFKKHQRRNHL